MFLRFPIKDSRILNPLDKDILQQNFSNTFNSAIKPPNGLRYPSRSTLVGGLVGGRRERRFAGTNFKPRKLPKNAQTPTTPAPLVLRGSGARCVGQFFAERVYGYSDKSNAWMPNEYISCDSISRA